MFSWDPTKNAGNQSKHGISFEEAVDLWRGKNVSFTARTENGEPRLGIIGEIKGVVWTAIFFERADGIRIISVRRARDYERILLDG